MILLVPGSTGTASASARQEPSAGAGPAVVGGFTLEGLAAIQAMMDTAVYERRIPSAIALLARDGEIVWIGTAGEMGPGKPMRNDAIIPLASVGKMYTAAAAMLLVERGVIALDDPVSRYIPELAEARVEVRDDGGGTRLEPLMTAITVRHLLTHTAGLRVTGDDFWAVWNEHSGRTTTTHFSQALVRLPLQSQPGTAYMYGQTGASYEVLAAVIEIAAGATLEAFMQENIFTPLDLLDTHFFLPEGKEDRMPAFYRRVDDELRLERAYGADFPRSSFFHGGGGVEASPRDIVRFAQIFLTDGTSGGVRLLQPDTITQMLTDQLGDLAHTRGRSWGFGSALRFTEDATGRRTLRQYGWSGGGYVRFWVDPVERVVAYFAFPLVPPGDNALLFQFERLVAAAQSQAPAGP